MPLKCLRKDEEIYAFDVESDTEWANLKQQNSISKNLRMPCCGASVVLRTSHLGTRYFAHARRGQCTTAPESAEHLLAKRIVIEGIRRTQWTALPEQKGETSDGASWRADVLAQKEKARIAFEIQWSRQTADETKRRQQRYKTAGVRGLWLFRQKDFPVERETPAFLLVFDEISKEFQVNLPSHFYRPEWMRGRDSILDYYWQQSVELSRFVEGALNGRLHFSPALGKKMPLEVHGAYQNCWRCRKVTGVVLKLVFAASRVLPGCANIPLSIHSFSESVPNGAQILMSTLPAETLRMYGIGALKPRYSKTEGISYLSNGCVHCDALQGRFFEHELAFEERRIFEIESVLKEEWGTLLEDASSYIHRWWFDNS